MEATKKQRCLLSLLLTQTRLKQRGMAGNTPPPLPSGRCAIQNVPTTSNNFGEEGGGED